MPIVIDGKDNVICGHTRLKACRKLGIDDVPCVVAADLNKAKGQLTALGFNVIVDEDR